MTKPVYVSIVLGSLTNIIPSGIKIKIEDGDIFEQTVRNFMKKCVSIDSLTIRNKDRDEWSVRYDMRSIAIKKQISCNLY